MGLAAAAALGGAAVALGRAEREVSEQQAPVDEWPRAAHLERAPAIGRTRAYQPPPAGRAAAAARPIGGFRCTRDEEDRYGVHLEVFARRIDMVIPAGIGVAPPRRRDGAYVLGGRCAYPVRTLEPTGLIEVEEGSTLTVGQFFDVWGQPLSQTRLAGFRARGRDRVAAWVDGRRWRGDPRRIPLARHAAIVLQVGGFFPPIPEYVFPSDL